MIFVYIHKWNSKMRIVIYTSNTNQSNALTKELMDSFSDTARIEKYKEIEDLEQRLASFPDIFVLILYMHDMESLKKLMQMKSLIAPVKTLLVLPDSRDEIVSSAHQLRPNYIGYYNETNLHQNLRAVIDRLILMQSK